MQPFERKKKTRYRPSKRRRWIPDAVIYVHVETYLNVDFSFTAQVKMQVKIQFQTLNKHQIFGFSCYITREDLSIDAPITNVGLRTDIDEAKVISALWHKSKFNFELFRKIKIWGFYLVVLVKTFPLIYQLIMWN